MGLLKGSYLCEESRYERRRAQAVLQSDVPTAPWVDRLLGRSGVPSSGPLLELGARDGNGTVFLANKGYAVTAVEVSPSAVALAQLRLSKSKGLTAVMIEDDPTTLSKIPSGKFPLALDHAWLQGICDLDDRREYLKSIHRVLTPGGILVGRSRCLPQNVAAAEKWHGDDQIMWMVDRGRPFAYRICRTEEEILGELKAVGLHVLWHEHQPFDADTEQPDTSNLAYMTAKVRQIGHP